MLPLDTIYNEDCLQGMRRMGDGTVDCRSLRPALPAGEPRRRLLVEELAARRSTLRVSEGRVMLASTMPKSAIKREQSSWLELPSVSRLAVRQRETTNGRRREAESQSQDCDSRINQEFENLRIMALPIKTNVLSKPCRHWKIKIWEHGRDEPIETEYLGEVHTTQDLIRHYGLNNPDVKRYEIEAIRE